MTVFVSIKENIDDADITCGVRQGDTLVLKHPQKLYLSVEAVGQGAGYSINARYSNSVSNINYVNMAACSDQGLHLGVIDRPTKPDTTPVE